jgi:hypothetical protein
MTTPAMVAAILAPLRVPALVAPLLARAGDRIPRRLWCLDAIFDLHRDLGGCVLSMLGTTRRSP